jgi:hypothetical protein
MHYAPYASYASYAYALLNFSIVVLEVLLAVIYVSQ